VSWFEAAAYCVSEGKALPTRHHWRNAAAVGAFSDKITAASNFSGTAPAPVGSFHGVGAYGTKDMAGNVKEWCWNRSEGERRYILGGAWDEPTYMFLQQAARSPWTREANFGFRCARYEEPIPEALLAPGEPAPPRDYSTETPMSDDLFEVVRGFYDYDPRDLRAEVESVDDSPRHWTRERVSYEAAYDHERITADLYLPRTGTAPHQAVVYFPGAGARHFDTITLYDLSFVDFLIRSGRAGLCPMYQETYERRSEDQADGEKAWRDDAIQQVMDVGRSVDYLASRDDIAADRLAYFGFSWGAWFGVVNTAVDDRFRASVLVAGGLPTWNVPREFDPFHFARRVTVPTLFVNGREDLVFPVETSVRPLFDLLGVDEPDKKLVLIDSGHGTPRLDVIRETLDWLDRYLGPVVAR
jgi:dienelactone hydrolase